VWAALWPVAVRIYSLLMTLTLNKTLKLEDRMFSCLLGSGFSLALSSVSCRVVQLLS
jgi:hypothetical protein